MSTHPFAFTEWRGENSSRARWWQNLLTEMSAGET